MKTPRNGVGIQAVLSTSFTARGDPARAERRGDLYVDMEVEMPRQLSEEQRRALREILV
jgi:DnaJ-class molecular chaperone